MSDRVHIGLDNPAFRGRLRQSVRRAQTQRTIRYQTVRPSARYVNDVAATEHPAEARAEPETGTPIDHRTQFRRLVRLNLQAAQATEGKVSRTAGLLRKLKGYSKLQLALAGMACFVFMFGLVVSVQGFWTNHAIAAQVSALSKKPKPPTTTGQAAKATTVPSTTKPSAQALSQYVVAPDLPRYLKIPKLGVDARVLQVGVTKTGALGTPDNVYDTAWYTGSAKPGQPGATLIDGHVSSWTAHGVFYGIKTLVAGDMIQIVRGDGAVLNYQVVKTQIYGANNVDMQAAMTPVTAGKPGLNLITCTGSVEPGTSLFNERVIVFAQQV